MYCSHVSYYVCALGNHESGFNFAHCTEFFRSQPANTGTVSTGASSTSPNNWWFSWNYGLVHFAAVSTEVFSYFNLTPPARSVSLCPCSPPKGSAEVCFGDPCRIVCFALYS